METTDRASISTAGDFREPRDFVLVCQLTHIAGRIIRCLEPPKAIPSSFKKSFSSWWGSPLYPDVSFGAWL